MDRTNGARGDDGHVRGGGASSPTPSGGASTSSKVWAGVGIAAVLIIATPFVVIRLHERSVAEQKCAGARKTLENRIAREDFDEIETFVVDAERRCGAEHAAELQGRRREIAEKEPAARQRQARERQADVEKQIAEREELARDSFPMRSKDIEKEIKNADTAIAGGRWPAATSAVARAEWGLDDFKGTQMEKEKRYQELAGKVTALRKKVNAHNAADIAVIEEAKRQLQKEAQGRR